MDDTGQLAAKMLWMIILTVTYFQVEFVTSVTVEEGKAAILTCPGFVPNPEHENEKYAGFTWFKASKEDHSKRVAFYDKVDGVQNTLGDLSGRATIDGTTGALEIPHTRVSDDHVYTCEFLSTASGDIENETQLVITVTPSESDLKVTASPPDPVREGTSVTFKCSVSRVRPPPKEMFWKFTDDENQHPGQYKNETNSDKLTASVSVGYTMAVNGMDNGRKLKCYYVTAAGNTIISLEEATVKVLFKPSGQPQVTGSKRYVKVNSTVTLICDTASVNGSITWYKWLFANGNELGNTTENTWTYKIRRCDELLQFVCMAGNAVGHTANSLPFDIEIQSTSQPTPFSIMLVILGTLLAFSLLGNLASAVYLWISRKPNNALSQTQKLLSDKVVHCNEKDDGNPPNTVESAPYDEVRILPPVMHYLKDENDGYVGPAPRNYVNISQKRKAAKLYENNPAAMPPPVYEEPDLREMPTYLELH